MDALLVTLFVTLLVTLAQGLKLDQIRLPSSQNVKYMPMGYDKPEKVVPCPAPSQSSSGGGKNCVTYDGFIRWKRRVQHVDLYD